MGKIKRILLWIAAVILGIIELFFLLALLAGYGAGAIPYIVFFAVPSFFVIRALRRTGARRSLPAASGVVCASPADDARVSFMSVKDSLSVTDYVVLDLETTGLSAAEDEIIEIAALKLDHGDLQRFCTFVRPKGRIPERVTQITGISASDVLFAPSFGTVAGELSAFLGDLPVVAHNARFDLGFLQTAFARVGIRKDLCCIDTLQLSRIAYPDMPNYKLATLIDGLELIPGEQQHRAESDAEAAMYLFIRCQKEISRSREAEKVLRTQTTLEDKAFHLNQYGMQAEAAGNVEKAVGYYEDILEDKAVLPNAYMRLAVIYKKQHRWEDVVRVCDAALAVLPGTPGKYCQPEEYEKRKAYALEKLAADRS